MVGILLLVSLQMVPLQGSDEKINRQKWDVAIAAVKQKQEKFASAKFLKRQEKKEYFNLIESGDEPVWSILNTIKTNKELDCYFYTSERIGKNSTNAPSSYGIIINDKYCFEIAKKIGKPWFITGLAHSSASDLDTKDVGFSVSYRRPSQQKTSGYGTIPGLFQTYFSITDKETHPDCVILKVTETDSRQFFTLSHKAPADKVNGTIQTELELDKTNGFIPVRMKQTCNIDNVKHFFTAIKKISFDNDLPVNIELETIWKITKQEGVDQNALSKTNIKYSYDDIPLNEFQLSDFGYAEPSEPGGWSVPLYAWGIVSALFFGGIFVFMKRRGSG